VSPMEQVSGWTTSSSTYGLPIQYAGSQKETPATTQRSTQRSRPKSAGSARSTQIRDHGSDWVSAHVATIKEESSSMAEVRKRLDGRGMQSTNPPRSSSPHFAMLL